MTDFTALLQPDRGQKAHSLVPVAAEGLDTWLLQQTPAARALCTAAQFRAKPGETVVLPGKKDDDWSVVYGLAKAPGPWDIAAVAAKLPAGTYRIEGEGTGAGALGWLLAQHRFDRYLSKPCPRASC